MTSGFVHTISNVKLMTGDDSKSKKAWIGY